MTDEPTDPTNPDIEDGGKDDIKRMPTPSNSRSSSGWVALAFLLITGYVGTAVLDRASDGLGMSSNTLLAFIGAGVMAFIAVTITTASGSVFGIRLFRGGERIPPSFRTVMALAQAFMTIAAVALIITFTR